MPAAATNKLIVRCPMAPEVGDAIRLNGNFVPLTAVESKGADAYEMTWAAAVVVAGFTAPTGIYSTASASVGAERFKITVRSDGAEVDRYVGLSLSPAHPGYYAKDGVINGASPYISVVAGAPAPALATAPYYVTSAALGGDAVASNSDYANALTELEKFTEPAMVICPDASRLERPAAPGRPGGQGGQRTASSSGGSRSSTRRIGSDDCALSTWRNATLSSTYAAVYAPHLEIVTIDPDSIDRFTTVPPSGFVAGVFARTDRERGVHKAPGNERVDGNRGPHPDLHAAPSGPAQPRRQPHPGVPWTRHAHLGCAQCDGRRHVALRQRAAAVQHDRDVASTRSTQWVVFEPNTATTWIRVKVSVENFLDQQWRAGALAGTKPEEAYRVRVGLGETMIEADIDAGLVITEVAIAPAKPAEFVIFRFSHKRLSE